ncbi:MAG: ChaB family protein, partial [Candidatus Kariarchaeaceae archaeon]
MPTGNLPKAAIDLWEKVYKNAQKEGDSDEKSAKKAYGAIKRAGWVKDKDGKWHKKAQLSEFSLILKSAKFDEATGERRWRADASDTDDDIRKDNMTLSLFSDFIGHIERNELAPEEFRSDFWQGGMPYLSVAHYSDLDGDGVPGPVEKVYIDGDFLKARGQYDDTPLGRACFKAICDDLYGENKESKIKNKVRISIAFLDWMHKHKSNGYLFEREDLSDICPECIIEMIKGEYEGKEFLKGQLVHLAHTRVPQNERTLMEVDKSMITQKEDAASIVGEEQAEELEEKKTLIGKSEALVIKAEDEPVEKAKKEKKKMEEDEEEEEKPKKKKEEKKAETVEENADVSLLLEQLKAQMVEPDPHPLDTVLEELKASYDQALETD